MKLDLDLVPVSLDHAVQLLWDSLEEEDTRFIFEHSAVETHMHLGAWLRNNWSLWDRETKLVRWFVGNLGIAHADDLSDAILTALWNRVHGIPFDSHAHVEKYKEYWREQGIDPITGEEVL